MITDADAHVYAGEDNLVIGTDYGHTDAYSEVDAIDISRANPGRWQLGQEKNT